MPNLAVIPALFGDNTLDFTWDPVLESTFSWAVGDDTYISDAPLTPVGELITFTAEAIAPIDSGRTFVKYEWDFGDGVKGYGAEVGHTFRFANPNLRVRCTVTDNEGHRTSVGHFLYLTFSELTLPFTIPATLGA